MTNLPSEYEARPVTGNEVPDYSTRDDFGATVPAEPASWPPNDSPNENASTTDVAKDEAGKVKDTAVDAGKQVAATAKDEAANVAAETKQQAKSLFGAVSSEVQTQAGTQQQKIASSMHALSKELGGMASGSAESGPLTDLAHEGARRGGEIASWLENHEPRDVLREVQSFARRRPVVFLALCGFAGVLAGRLTRGAVAANTELDSPSSDKPDVEPPRRALDTSAGYQAAPASMVDELPTTYEDNGSVYLTQPVQPEYAPAQGYGSADPLNPIGDPTERPGGVR